MMEIIKLNATKRPESGKGPSTRLRRQGQIPAIAYGRDLTPTPIAVSPKALAQVLNSAHGKNSVVEIEVEGGEKIMSMVRDYSYHPISRDLIHADFVQVKLDQPVDVEVPFHLVGKAKGVVLGGMVQQIFRWIPIRCLPEKIPAFVEADVTELGLGEAFKANHIMLPEGVQVRLPEDKTVAVVNAPEKGAEEEAAAGAPGAPAAAGKAAAKPAAKAEKKK